MNHDLVLDSMIRHPEGWKNSPMVGMFGGLVRNADDPKGALEVVAYLTPRTWSNVAYPNAVKAAKPVQLPDWEERCTFYSLLLAMVCGYADWLQMSCSLDAEEEAKHRDRLHARLMKLFTSQENPTTWVSKVLRGAEIYTEMRNFHGGSYPLAWELASKAGSVREVVMEAGLKPDDGDDFEDITF